MDFANIEAIEDIINLFGTDNIAVYVTVGYRKMNSYRQAIYDWLLKRNIEILSYKHPNSYISPDCKNGIRIWILVSKN